MKYLACLSRQRVIFQLKYQGCTDNFADSYKRPRIVYRRPKEICILERYQLSDTQCFIHDRTLKEF